MGGQLGVSTSDSAGNTLWIDLVAGGDTEADPEASAGGDEPSQTYRVLYVEDDPGNARLIASALSRRSDIEIDIAPRGEVGIAMAHDRQPDLILLDVHLPDIPGDEVLRRLRDNEATRLTPVTAALAGGGVRLGSPMRPGRH